MEKSDFYLIKEHGRGLNKSRKYDVYIPESDQPVMHLHEKAGAFKSLWRLMSSSPLMSTMKIPATNKSGETEFIIKRGVNLNAEGGFKVLDASGTQLAAINNKIKFKDDSYLEVFDEKKNLMYKSAIQAGYTRDFPIYVFRPGKETENSAGSISIPKEQIIAEIGDNRNPVIKEIIQGFSFPTKDSYYLRIEDPELDEKSRQILMGFVLAVDFARDAS